MKVGKKVQKSISDSEELIPVVEMLALLVRSPLEHLFYFYFYVIHINNDRPQVH